MEKIWKSITKSPASEGLFGPMYDRVMLSKIKEGADKFHMERARNYDVKSGRWDHGDIVGYAPALFKMYKTWRSGFQKKYNFTVEPNHRVADVLSTLKKRFDWEKEGLRKDWRFKAIFEGKELRRRLTMSEVALLPYSTIFVFLQVSSPLSPFFFVYSK